MGVVAHHAGGMYGKGRAGFGVLGGLNLREFAERCVSERQFGAWGCHVGSGFGLLGDPIASPYDWIRDGIKQTDHSTMGSQARQAC